MPIITVILISLSIFTFEIEYLDNKYCLFSLIEGYLYNRNILFGNLT